ncbi:hypothetical protein, partial [Escherichia coli]
MLNAKSSIGVNLLPG